ncbi:FMN-dependent dehydrogenase [Chytriomyces sp. MP71]|nr:FMN-dependent dehydrogenase [Chytriomyces sp. MP71]
MKSDVGQFACIEDVHKAALRTMDSNTRNYYESGAVDQITLGLNASDFGKILLRPRVLTDVSVIDLSTTILDECVSSPLAIAPSAMHGLVHNDAEKGTGKAAARTNTLMTLSSYSNTALEDVVAQVEGTPHMPPYWIQLYVHKDRSIAEGLVRKAIRAGYKAVVLTVDAPVLGRRLEDIRNKFAMPPHLKLLNFSEDQQVTTQSAQVSTPDAADVQKAKQKGAVADASLSWKDLDWLRSVTGKAMKIVLKGIMTPEDAVLACEWNVDAFIISNHGGRQLDTTPSTISVLPAIKAAVDTFARSHPGRHVPEIYLDGGVRRGTDVIKAIALGARAVFIGRPVLWGLAVGGADGVQHVLRLFHEEMRNGMALLGVTKVEDIGPSCVQLKSAL